MVVKKQRKERRTSHIQREKDRVREKQRVRVKIFFSSKLETESEIAFFKNFFLYLLSLSTLHFIDVAVKQLFYREVIQVVVNLT